MAKTALTSRATMLMVLALSATACSPSLPAIAPPPEPPAIPALPVQALRGHIGLIRCQGMRAPIGIGGLFKHICQRGLALAGSCGPLFFLGGDVVIGHLQAHLLGQVLHGFHKTHARMVHEKADGIAVFAAAKAVIELLGGADAE